MSLFAPLAVPVEVRVEARENASRVFRLSASVSESSLFLERPAAFDIGRPVTVSFTLPDFTSSESLSLRALIALADDDGEGANGGSHLVFVDPPREARQAIVRYVAGRLGLPGAEHPR